ncbi:hypothetical protein ACP275_13G013100 [Erythranthe tilingii]
MDLPSASSQGADEFVGSKRVIKKVELVRVITEALYSLGYDRAKESLERESGIQLRQTVPYQRLVDLVEQAIEYQKGACKFHSSLVKEVCLFTNHHCGREGVPTRSFENIRLNGGGIKSLFFSHNGKYLAAIRTFDQDLYAAEATISFVTIWETEGNGAFNLEGELFDNQKPVTYITWSPDNLQLLTCSTQESVRRWSIPSCECLHIYEKVGVGMVSCEWSPDGKTIFTSVDDDSIVMWNLEGKELRCWSGNKTTRIADLAITGDGREVITTCNENRILLFDWKSNISRFLTEEGSIIVSFCLSEDSNYLLLSLLNQELHLWCIEVPPKLVKVYKGHSPRSSARACFGGAGQVFIASGSEDSQVYIWDRETEELICTLSGHPRNVNGVCWNPVDPYMLASGCDDGTLRVWKKLQGPWSQIKF